MPRSVDVIHRVALQPADHDGLVFRAQHAGAFAQFLHRTDARAGRAQQIRFENRPRRADQIVRSDLLDEARNVDVRRAGVRAGRVVAEQAAVGLDQRFLRAQRRKLLGQPLVAADVRSPPELQLLSVGDDAAHQHMHRPRPKPRIPRTRRSRRASASAGTTSPRERHDDARRQAHQRPRIDAVAIFVYRRRGGKDRPH